ncbi:hypothetical protein [Mucilaginibacter sp. SP1R1]|uniref:hypothetical protein n=1 Tax=Mucilaginibacter sp. SP1R1 TaxID=2723091 RepID=UPI00160ADACF|nr:hypothetical protein [Mucilaginibacter sp. SP1R1]MBB6150570.1 hypothetical protein [Mucilaginibacter sp. SP1R1]
MKSSFIKVLLCGVILLITFNARAQDQDYVITLKGDTIHCKVSKSIFGAFSYKAPGMDDSKRIKIDDIKEFDIAKKKTLYTLVHRDDKNKPEFMEVVEKGNISLYQVTYYSYSQYGSTTTTNWFVGKRSDTVSLLKTNGLFATRSRQQRKDSFSEMLKDKKEIYDKYVAEDKFSFEQIANLVHLYNTGEPIKK